MNGMVSTAPRALDAQSRLADLAAAAYRQLRAEFLAAARTLEPSTTVRAPGYASGERTLQEVLDEDMREDERRDVYRLLLAVAHGEPITTEVRLRANVVVAAVANRHAAYHCGDAADAAGEDA